MRSPPILLAALALLLPALAVAEEFSAGERTAMPAGQDLRGFGRVAVARTMHRADGRMVAETEFSCASATRAATLAGKLLADLGLSPGVVGAGITVGAGRVPATLMADGAAWCAAVQGGTVRVLCAARQEDLAAFAAQRPEAVAGAVASAPYPAFLDRFDRYGWGLYGMEGHRGGDWERHAAKLQDPDGPKTPDQDLDWLVRHGFRFEPHLDPVMGHINGDGLVRNTETEWKAAYANARGLPLSYRLYGSAQSREHDWTNRRFAAWQSEPAGFLQRYIDYYSPWCEASWFAPDIHRYEAVKARDQIRAHANPMAMGWMHPYGEFTVGLWSQIHSDYSRHARASWRAELRRRGWDLAEVSRLYGRAGQPFSDWAQVPIPEFATFSGLGGQVLDLAGDWWLRQEHGRGFRPDEGWWGRSEAERWPGVAGAWWDAPLDEAWTPVRMPGGDVMNGLFPWGSGNSEQATTWFRRSFPLTRGQIGSAPLYLYWFPISRDGIHSGERALFHPVWINGERAGGVGQWGALEVSRLLRPGDNRIAVQLHGPAWEGRIFLSREAPRMYPYLGEAGNRLWLAWREWLVGGRVQGIATVLDGMRQADPDRPIKFMAPLKLGSEQWLALARDWGGFAHFTGEGSWFYPWYKRYGWLHGLPGSSETAGPPRLDGDPVADQHDSFRRVFLAGLNAHDPVFVAEWYTRHPGLRRWWEAHNPVLKQLGRFDLAGPQVLLYRGSFMDSGRIPLQPHPKPGLATRQLQTPWDWDLGRGTMQTLGQSYVYIDDGGLADGRMNGHRLIIDGGNEFIPDASLAALEDWVRAGGTFVALPFTGRSSPIEPDSWRMRGLAGCGIAGQRQPGRGTVTVARGQSVLPAHAGRTLPDAGSSVDWQGNQLNQYSLVLQPGPGCEVLATYEDGTAAVVRRRLGSGSVIWFGSVFWRDSGDRRGVWWPGERETAFVADLLEGVGHPPAPCVSDDRLVWPQPYRSNNGQDLVTVLVSWHDAKDAEPTLRLRTQRRPARLVSFGVDGERDLPFEWDGREAVVRLSMPAREVKVLRALGCVDPADALAHWWGQQQRMWHELRKPAIDLEPYTRGVWEDPTLDLRPGARFTSQAPDGDAWTRPGFDDAAWKPAPMTVLGAFGAEPGRPLWLRRSFTVPGSWTGGRIRLVSGGVWWKRYVGTARMLLNGEPFHDWGGDFTDLDVTARLRPGENVVAIEFKGDRPAQGVLGQVYLYHRPQAAASLSLAGAWQASDQEGRPAEAVLPGRSDLLRPARRVIVPAEWAGRYRVRLYLEGSPGLILQARVNGLIFRRITAWPQPNDMDITSALRFGEENVIELPAAGHREPWNITEARLDAYPAP